MDDAALLELCHAVVDAVEAALATVDDWSPAGDRPGQYALDLVADRAALDVLDQAGLGVWSEESGQRRTDAELMAVIDPVDGSTNASRRLPWYASSICILDADGPRAAVVADLAHRRRFAAGRGRGATVDGTPLRPSACRRLSEAVVALAGMTDRHLGWAQFRAFGAAALDLCAVAEGTVDAFTVGARAQLAPWDYLGALLVCQEAGVPVVELAGRPLVTRQPGARASVAAAATAELLAELQRAARPPG